jgi:phosphate transport system substrate-binding protein
MLKVKTVLSLVFLFLLGQGYPSAAISRDYISIVGSSTVYPFATVVAERLGRGSALKTPKIEATGTGGGIKLFCQGVGQDYPDITNASRRIMRSELKRCASNGVAEVVEVLIGYDGIVLANAKNATQFSLSLREIYLALAKEVPNPKMEGEFIANPYRSWKELNARLPNVKIEVLGPPPTSGTRDAFVELAMEAGCNSIPVLKALAKTNKDKHKNLCHRIREDGAFIEAGENDNLIVQKLGANTNSLGIFGYSFLEQNADKVQGSIIEGAAPTFENIADGKYSVSRPLYFYVKKAHIGQIPGILEYLNEFTANKAWGDDGYLADKGMIPLPVDKRDAVKKSVIALESVKL